MARPIWNGSISFGLLNVPVQLHSGERSVDLSFRMLDSRDKSPIRYERVNSETGEEVPWKEIVKAFEYAKGSYVVIDEEDIRKAAPDATETVEIETFVERAAIDPRYFDKPYYLVPAKKAEKGYVLLREILARTGKIGIAKVVIRTRQYLAALMPHDKALVLNLMRFPQELVDADELHLPAGGPAKWKVSEREMAMAEQLIESMTAAWNPADYSDDFRSRLRKIIDGEIARQGGKKVKAPRVAAGKPVPTSNVIDFTALLKQSLAGKDREAPKTSAKKTSEKKAAKSRPTRRTGT